MSDEKEMTALESSVGADGEQSSQKCNDDIIPDETADYNSFDEDFDEWTDFPDGTRLSTMTMDELYDTAFETRPPLIDGFLYPGTYLFAGAPKYGKSFLSLQIAYHVSTGKPLWDLETSQGTVLYLALEDTFQRLQKRSYRMFGTESTPDLHFAVLANKAGAGLNDQLQSFIDEHPKTRLIIIDTLQRIRADNLEKSTYAADYDVVVQLKEFVDRNRLCLLLVHHTRKQKAKDIYEEISGTQGLFGAADGAILFYKESRISDYAQVNVTGRDQPDQIIDIVRDDDTLTWSFVVVETDLWQEPSEPILEALSAWLHEYGREWTGTATELAALLDTDLKPNKLSTKLNVHADKLLKEYGIAYRNTRTHDGRRITLCLTEA